jgi:hypothetical protein
MSGCTMFSNLGVNGGMLWAHMPTEKEGEKIAKLQEFDET